MKQPSMTDESAEGLVKISQWLDKANAFRDPEAVTWGRLAKCAEETGEVVSAFISLTGQNPRKPQDDTAFAKVLEELLDVAVTALGAYEHMTDHNGMSMIMLHSKIKRIIERAGI